MESLRTIRKQRDLTLAQVAEKTGLSLSYLSDLERGRCDPSLSSLRRIAACYHVPVAYLLAEEGNKMSQHVRVPVTEFFVSPSILFQCVFCGVANESRQSGPFHVSTGDHCENCKASYTIQWHEIPEQSTIEMTRADVSEDATL